MKIIGILSWYDESPTWLAAAVSGFTRLCDVIVAVDGAYALYPGGRNVSHPDQAEAIQLACEAAEKGCILHRPRHVWFGNEVEKRQHTLKLAATVAEPGDWLCVFDSDYMVMRCDPQRIRQELTDTDLDVATYTLLDHKDHLSNAKVQDFVANVDIATEWTVRTRDVYRWVPDLAYGPAHYTLRGTYAGREQWIRGPELTPNAAVVHDIVPCHDLNTSLVCYHRTEQRAKVRRDAAWEYYRNRDATGIERLDVELEPLAA